MTKRLHSQLGTTITAYALLALAGTVSILLPDSVAPPSAFAQAGPVEYELTGLVRDFLSSHPDFNVVPPEGFGHAAGNVDGWLPFGTNRPVFTGGGYRVDSQWTDQDGNPIAPHMAGVRSTGVGSGQTLGLRVAGDIELRSETYIDAFNSNYGPYGMAGNFGSDALVTTNAVTAGAVHLDSKAFLRGDVLVGTGSDPTLVIANQGIISGSKGTLSEVFEIPDVLMPENDMDSVDLQPFVPVVDLSGIVTLVGDTTSEDGINDPAIWTGQFNMNPMAILNVQGDLRIRVDGDLTLDRAEIVLGTDAVLSFFVTGDIRITDQVRVNVSPGNTTSVTINAAGPGLLLVEKDSHLFATLVAPLRELHVKDKSHVYGSFLGASLLVESKGSAMHVDQGNTVLGQENFALAVRDRVQIEDDSYLDSFDSGLGPYGGMNVAANAAVSVNSKDGDHVVVKSNSVINGDVLVGPWGDPDKVVDVDGSSLITGSVGAMSAPIGIPVITPPPMGPDLGHLHWTAGGTYTISSDMRCKHLKLENGTIVNIDGDVTIRCDDKIEMKNGSEIRLLPGARLTIYIKKEFKLEGNCLVNMNTANPQLLWVRRNSQEDGKIVIKGGSQMAAWIQGAKTELQLENFGELFGSFAGKKAVVKKNSAVHVDTAFIGSCGGIADAFGVAGVPTNEAITSAGTFDEWFNDVLGVNQAGVHTITMTRDLNGVYEHLNSGFYPIDGMLLGNEGTARNDFFTYDLEAEFTYQECGGQFVEFQGGDGAWLFVNSHLVLDLGGVTPFDEQYADLDRLGLVDGETYRLRLFYAHRNAFSAVFRLRTNLELTSRRMPTVTAAFD